MGLGVLGWCWVLRVVGVGLVEARCPQKYSWSGVFEKGWTTLIALKRFQRRH